MRDVSQVDCTGTGTNLVESYFHTLVLTVVCVSVSLKYMFGLFVAGWYVMFSGKEIPFHLFKNDFENEVTLCRVRFINLHSFDKR